MTLRVFITFFTAFNPLGLEGSNQERGRCCAVSKGYYWNQRLSPEQDAPSALSPFKIMLNLIQGNRQCCREWRWCAGCSLGLGEEVWKDGVPKNLFVHLRFSYCFWSGGVCGQMVALEKKQHIFYNPQDPVLCTCTAVTYGKAVSVDAVSVDEWSAALGGHWPHYCWGHPGFEC